MTIPRPRNEQQEPTWQVLNTVLDPEVGYGIVDLGLVYEVAIRDGIATVTMTLTSPMCPAGPEIMDGIREVLRGTDGISDVIVDLVWEPAWNADMVDEHIRGMLFGTDDPNS